MAVLHLARHVGEPAEGVLDDVVGGLGGVVAEGDQAPVYRVQQHLARRHVTRHMIFENAPDSLRTRITAKCSSRPSSPREGGYQC